MRAGQTGFHHQLPPDWRPGFARFSAETLKADVSRNRQPYAKTKQKHQAELSKLELHGKWLSAEFGNRMAASDRQLVVSAGKTPERKNKREYCF